MYLQEEVFPIFSSWVSAQKSPIKMSQAREYGQYFIANHIDPAKIKDTGEVYYFFEKVADFANSDQMFNSSKMTDSEMMVSKNMETLARGVVRATEHDGHDRVKHDPITEWGYDIMHKKGMPPEEM